MLLCALLVVAHHGEVFTPVPRDRRCFICVLLGFHRLLRHLIQRDIDVDARDANGYTALHLLLYRVDWHVLEFQWKVERMWRLLRLEDGQRVR